MRRWLWLAVLVAVSSVAQAQNPPLPAAAAYVNPGSGFTPWAAGLGSGAITPQPPGVALYCSSDGVTWTPCNPNSAASGVTSVSVVTANGVSGTVANPTTTPAITLSLGAINPSSTGATTPGSATFTTLSTGGPSGISAYVPNQLSYAFNVSPYLMPHWTSCVARVKINAGNCRVYAIGDSTTFGSFSTGVGDTGNLTLGSYPTRLSVQLNSSLLPAQRDSFMGDGGPAETTGVNDARVTLHSWSQASSSNAALWATGGSLFTATANGSGPMTFLPTDNVDTFRIWYIQVGGLGSFSYAVNGGSATTVSENGTSGVFSVTATAALGSNTLDLAWVSGAAVYIVGVEAYNSAIGSVQIVNAGWPASNVESWQGNSNPWNPFSSVVAQAPDVILLDLGINDWQGATTPAEPVATFKSNLQALITQYQTTSDVILVTPNPSANTSALLANQQAFVAAMYQLATTNNIPIIDNFSRWGSYERTNPAPFLFYNQALHPSAAGYSDFAQAIAQWMLLPTGQGSFNAASPGAIGATTPGPVYGTTINATGGITAQSDNVHAGYNSLIGNIANQPVVPDTVGEMGPTETNYNGWAGQPAPSTSGGPTANQQIKVYGQAVAGVSLYTLQTAVVSGGSAAPDAYTCGQSTFGAGPISCTWSTNPPIGRYILCGVVNNNLAANTLTDSNSDVYAPLGAQFLAGAENSYIQTYIFGPLTASISTMTLSSANGSHIAFQCQSVANLSLNTDGGPVSAFANTATSVSVGPIVTTQDNDYIFCQEINSYPNTQTAGTGFTLGSTSFPNSANQYMVQAVAGSITPSMTTTANGISMTCTAFQSASPPPYVSTQNMTAGSVHVSVTGCGTITNIKGGALAGQFTGGSSTCTPVITTGVTAPAGYSCFAQDQTTSTAAFRQTASTPTTITFTAGGTVGATDVIDFGCDKW